MVFDAKKVLNNRDLIGSLLIFLFSTAYLVIARDIPSDPSGHEEFFTARTFPVFLAIVAITSSILHMAKSLVRSNGESSALGWRQYRWRPVFLLLLLMSTYALTFEFLGFAIGTVLLLVLGFAIMGERNPVKASLVALGTVFFIWTMLTQVFGLYLDSGTVMRWIFG